MIPKGTPIYNTVQRGEFKPMEPLQILGELEGLVSNLNLTNCIFRTNHASNYLPLGGVLNRDKERILETLRETITTADESNLRPGYLRGL
ncbi:MAG: radical SAM protein, partial [Candidatus Thorarchaeota archaeon]|nr:radical SAM protein [Candidatus Thorarchaeota archaeon]